MTACVTCHKSTSARRVIVLGQDLTQCAVCHRKTNAGRRRASEAYEAWKAAGRPGSLAAWLKDHNDERNPDDGP